MFFVGHITQAFFGQSLAHIVDIEPEFTVGQAHSLGLFVGDSFKHFFVNFVGFLAGDSSALVFVFASVFPS